MCYASTHSLAKNTLYVLLSIFLLAISYKLPATERVEFKQVNLVSFVNENQISQKMIEKKQRLMLKPSAIQFDAKLKARPKQGKYNLVYEALSLWGEGKMPNITHSGFIEASDGRVLSVYVSNQAEQQIRSIPLGQPTNFYAIHIYNYAKGPRLIIVGAQAL